MADVVENDEALLKLIKKLPAKFQEEADAMKESELRDCIVQSEVNLKNEIAKFEDDDHFQKLKVAYKEAAGPLADAKKAQKAKIAYCLHLLEQKGKI